MPNDANAISSRCARQSDDLWHFPHYCWPMSRLYAQNYKFMWCRIHHHRRRRRHYICSET